MGAVSPAATLKRSHRNGSNVYYDRIGCISRETAWKKCDGKEGGRVGHFWVFGMVLKYPWQFANFSISLCSLCRGQQADTKAPFTRYNLLSNHLSNRFDNRLYRVYKHSNGCQTRMTTGLTTGWMNSGCSFNTVVTWQNRLYVCLHDTAGCQTSCTTGLTTGCIV